MRDPMERWGEDMQVRIGFRLCYNEPNEVTMML